MTKALLLALLLPVFSPTAAEVLDVDPSTIPLEQGEGIKLSKERYRIRGDFNFDGREDLALSESRSTFGKAQVGNFQVYLRDKEGKFVKHGEPIYLCAYFVSIEKFLDTIIIWTYERTGPQGGFIGYYTMMEKGFSKWVTIGIRDRGHSAPKIGRAIYKAVFDNSDVELIMEKSETTGDKVTWKPIITRKTEPKEAINRDD